MSTPTLLLGQVACELEHSYWKDSHGGAEAAIRAFDQKFADRYRNRLDYRVWRSRWPDPDQAVRSLTARYPLPPFADPTEAITDFSSHFAAAAPAVQWGVVAALLSDRDDDWNGATSLIPVVRQWLSRPTPGLLNEVPAECAVVALRAGGLLVDFDLQGAKKGDLGWQKRYSDYLAACKIVIRFIDNEFDYEVGAEPDRFRAEARRGGTLIPLHLVRLRHLLTKSLGRALRLPSLIKRATGVIAVEVNSPAAADVFECAYAAWRMSIADWHHLRRGDNGYSGQVEKQLFRTMKSTAYAARVAGDHLGFAGLWRWYQACVPGHLLTAVDRADEFRPPRLGLARDQASRLGGR